MCWLNILNPDPKRCFFLTWFHFHCIAAHFTYYIAKIDLKISIIRRRTPFYIFLAAWFAELSTWWICLGWVGPNLIRTSGGKSGYPVLQVKQKIIIVDRPTKRSRLLVTKLVGLNLIRTSGGKSGYPVLQVKSENPKTRKPEFYGKISILWYTVQYTVVTNFCGFIIDIKGIVSQDFEWLQMIFKN